MQIIYSNNPYTQSVVKVYGSFLLKIQNTSYNILVNITECLCPVILDNVCLYLTEQSAMWKVTF